MFSIEPHGSSDAERSMDADHLDELLRGSDIPDEDLAVETGGEELRVVGGEVEGGDLGGVEEAVLLEVEVGRLGELFEVEFTDAEEVVTGSSKVSEVVGDGDSGDGTTIATLGGGWRGGEKEERKKGKKDKYISEIKERGDSE